jgi:hypothetical protein
MTNRVAKMSGKELPAEANVFAEPRYVWLFHCSNRLALHAATLDRRGRKLPSNICQGGTWTVSGQLTVEPDSKSSRGN